MPKLGDQIVEFADQLAMRDSNLLAKIEESIKYVLQLRQDSQDAHDGLRKAISAHLDKLGTIEAMIKGDTAVKTDGYHGLKRDEDRSRVNVISPDIGHEFFGDPKTPQRS